MGKVKWYAVRKGRNPGIYDSWEECDKNIKGFKGAEYKSFSNKTDASRYYVGSTKSTESEKKYTTIDQKEEEKEEKQNLQEEKNITTETEANTKHEDSSNREEIEHKLKDNKQIMEVRVTNNRQGINRIEEQNDEDEEEFEEDLWMDAKMVTCRTCNKEVGQNAKAIQCDNCNTWYHTHTRCGINLVIILGLLDELEIKNKEHKMNNQLKWECERCEGRIPKERQLSREREKKISEALGQVEERDKECKLLKIELQRVKKEQIQKQEMWRKAEERIRERLICELKNMENQDSINNDIESLLEEILQNNTKQKEEMINILNENEDERMKLRNEIKSLRKDNQSEIITNEDEEVMIKRINQQADEIIGKTRKGTKDISLEGKLSEIQQIIQTNKEEVKKKIGKLKK